MKRFGWLGALVAALALTGCSQLAVWMTPDEVIDGVQKNAAVARSMPDEELTHDQIQQYLKTNAEAWSTIENFYVGEED